MSRGSVNFCETGLPEGSRRPAAGPGAGVYSRCRKNLEPCQDRTAPSGVMLSTRTPDGVLWPSFSLVMFRNTKRSAGFVA